MSMLKLASAGDDVKLWECNDFGLVKEFFPHDDNVCGLSWSTDGNRLASVGSNSEKISIHSVTDNVVPLAELNCGLGQLCVRYCNASSRYLLCGGRDQTFTVWDLKSCQVKKTYKNHKGPVTTALFNKDDTHIASGSQSGEIIVYNVITGQGCKPMVAPKVHAIQQIEYSKTKKSLLGAASDDGSINLWDTNTRQLIHGFTGAHRAPATDLCFSPINDLLLTSVGLDKRIIFYDLKSMKPVNIKVTERPLTSLDVMSDGATIATGSINGKISVYDLRKGSSPIKVIDAHKSSVQVLQFQNMKTSEGSSERQPLRPVIEENIMPPSERRQLPVSPPSQGGQIEHTEPMSATPFSLKSNISDDAFSPIHNASGDGLSSFHSERFRGSTSNSGFAMRQDLSGSGVFSPLADGDPTQRTRFSGSNLSPLGSRPFPGNLQSPSFNNVFSPGTDQIKGISQRLESTSIQQTEQSETSTKSPELGAGTSDHVTPDGSPRLPFTTGHVTTSSYSPPSQNSTSQIPSQNSTSHVPSQNSTSHIHTSISPSQKQYTDTKSSVELAQTNNSPRNSTGLASGYTSSETLDTKRLSMNRLDYSPSGSAGAESYHRILTSPEGAQTVNSSVNRGQERLQSHDLPGASAAMHAGSNFQLEFLRNFIRDEMEEMWHKIHEENWQLFLDMLRLNTQMKNEIQQMLQAYSVNPALLEEIERLKEENSRLKKMF
ncbi:hypothetical protein FSP39_014046 [Pinctada imbricata]|uniref:Uncharacterized protein n=1 Tax=Pinctada imbricata TaxID=66713 RepID=A0AA88YD38_PINIB|nr:hypothetical protein FSP39_014046 [Pinctada imbricata]